MPEQLQNTQPTEQLTFDGELPIPMYDPRDQYSVDDLETLWPEWRTGHFWEDLDPEETERTTDKELLLMAVADLHDRRQIAGELGWMADHVGGEGLEKAIDQIPNEVGFRYDAHGIAGKSGAAIYDLDRLLTTGIDTDRGLYSMNLVYAPEAGGAMGADRPFTEGGLIAVSGKDEKLMSDGIKSVIVGENYIRCVDVLRQKYPEVDFIPWNEVTVHFINEVNTAENTSYTPKKLKNLDQKSNEQEPSQHNTVAVSGGEVAMHSVVSIEDDTFIEDVW